MGKVVKVSGPLVVATSLSDANMSDVVRVGPSASSVRSSP